MEKKKRKVNISLLLRRGLLCGLLLYIFILFLSQQFNLSRLSKENDALDQQIAEAQIEHEQLKAQQEASQTDEYIERVAREKLGYMKPDEKVFIDAKKQ